MNPTREEVERCRCTSETDCDDCKELERRGYSFIEVNGEKGVAMLLEERDALLDENERLRADYESACNANGKLRDENERLKKKTIDLYKCIGCEGLHPISAMLPSTCDPESAPVCRACIKSQRQAAVVEAAQELHSDIEARGECVCVAFPAREGCELGAALARFYGGEKK